MPPIGQSKILIIASDRFEESELFGPRAILLERGAKLVLAAPGRAAIQGTVRDEPGRSITPDATLDEVDAAKFDALLLPGGVSNPDHLRTNPRAMALVNAFAAAGKPVAAICHAPWLLVEADLLRGRRATCWPSIRTDLSNAGARVEDEAVVRDGKFITARGPDDVAAFTEALVAAVEEAD